MTDVALHQVHHLVRRDDGTGAGWYAPAELASNDWSGSGIVIPMRGDGGPFPKYWFEVAIFDAGQRTVHGYELVVDADRFRFDHFSADVTFVARDVPEEQRLLPYLGALYHPDFAYRLMEIVPVQDEAYDLLLNHESVVLIGSDPVSHYRMQDGKPVRLR